MLPRFQSMKTTPTECLGSQQKKSSSRLWLDVSMSLSHIQLESLILVVTPAVNALRAEMLNVETGAELLITEVDLSR